MERWMALQIYCGVTGSKDIIGSGRKIALLDRTGSMEKNVCMRKIQNQSADGFHECGPFSPVSSLTCAKNDILDA